MHFPQSISLHWVDAFPRLFSIHGVYPPDYLQYLGLTPYHPDYLQMGLMLFPPRLGVDAVSPRHRVDAVPPRHWVDIPPFPHRPTPSLQYMWLTLYLPYHFCIELILYPLSALALNSSSSVVKSLMVSNPKGIAKINNCIKSKFRPKTME